MAIVNGLITLDDARKSIFGNTYATAPTTLDTDLERYIEAATPVIENITGPILPTTGTYYFNGGRPSVNLPCAARSITSVTESGTAITDFQADLNSGIVYAGALTSSRNFLPGIQNIVVVAAIGLTATPPNVLLAAKELVRFWWQVGRQANRPGTAEQVTDAELPTGMLKRVAQLCAPTFDVGGFA